MTEYGQALVIAAMAITILPMIVAMWMSTGEDYEN